MKSEKGLAIIEVVLVILILGVLSAVAYPKFSTLTDDARTANMMAIVGAVRSGIGLYYSASGGQYPVALDSASANGAASADNRLFDAILLYGVEDGAWYKNSQYEYQYQVNATTLYVWEYDAATGSFTSAQLEETGAPPGQGGLPPGQGGTPPGQSSPAPGQEGSTPGSGTTPPGQGNTPPGQGGSPPGQGGTPPGHQAK